MGKNDDVLAYLKALGISSEMDSFLERKRIQKTVYLLKQFGADLKFGFSWYLHGPYSPELTKMMFESSVGKNIRSLNSREMDIVNKMRNFLAEDFYSVDKLELIVSLIYLKKHSGLHDDKEIFEFLKEKKPQFNDDEITQAWKKIKENIDI